jgi:hypothetical protein
MVKTTLTPSFANNTDENQICSTALQLFLNFTQTVQEKWKITQFFTPTNDWTDFHEIKLAGQLFAKSPIPNFLENPTNCLVDNTRSRDEDGRKLSPHKIVYYLVCKECLNLFKQILPYKTNRRTQF